MGQTPMGGWSLARMDMAMYRRHTYNMHLPTYRCSRAWFQGDPKIALRGGGGGGDGMGTRRRRGGGFQKWASVPGPLFCVRTDIATKGAGTQNLARKNFFTKKFSPTYV